MEIRHLNLWFGTAHALKDIKFDLRQREELLLSLKRDHAIVVVTRSMMQARSVADRVASFHFGWLKELASKEAIFS